MSLKNLFKNFQVIFLDNFMKKIYNFINGVEMLHLYGTYEQEQKLADFTAILFV